jgi:hypothetical protein
MVPVAGKAAKTGTKVVKAGIKATAQQGTKQVAKKGGQELAEQGTKQGAKQTEKKAAKKKNDGGKIKGKKKLKCGEYGKYGDLKKKGGDGKFDRDHIPSKAALKERAEALLKEEKGPKAKLSVAQKRAIDNWGDSIAVPRQAHIDISPTHGTKNIKLAPKDAENLAGAARRDVDAMLKNIEKYDADGGCKKTYQKASKRILRMSNKDFDKALSDIIGKTR